MIPKCFTFAVATLFISSAAFGAPGTDEHVRIRLSPSTGPTQSYALLKEDGSNARLEHASGTAKPERKPLNVPMFDHLVKKYVKGAVEYLADENPAMPTKCRKPATIEWKLAKSAASADSGTKKVCLDAESGSGVKALIEVFHSMTIGQ